MMAKHKRTKRAPSTSNPYQVIKGQFLLYYENVNGRHVGLQPDGDTIGFMPDRGPSAFKDIEKDAVPGAATPEAVKRPRQVDFSDAGLCSLRFEAIDAIELHFQGAHQDDALAKASRDRMLHAAGFQNFVFSGARQTSGKSAQPHPVKGYIIARSVDPNGRVVSFVFAGTPAESDGEQIFLTAARVRGSLNAGIAKAGQCYPTFYTGLPTDLRETIANLCRAAQSPAKGIWKRPDPRKPAGARNLGDLEASKIWPKLFRRLVSFFKETGGPLSGFTAWLRSSGSDDALFILPIRELGNLHDVIQVANGKISLKYDTSELIIVPK